MTVRYGTPDKRYIGWLKKSIDLHIFYNIFHVEYEWIQSHTFLNIAKLTLYYVNAIKFTHNSM